MADSRDYVETVIDEWTRIDPHVDLKSLSLTLRLIRAGRILEAQLDDTVSAHGFATAGDYEVLATLRRCYPDPLQPAQLAEQALVTTSGMTGRLDRLERASYIERRAHPRDRRAIEIHITPSGIATCDTVFALRLRTDTRQLASMSDEEQENLATLLRILLSNLEEDASSGAAAPSAGLFPAAPDD